jgi:hypothetical protein
MVLSFTKQTTRKENSIYVIYNKNHSSLQNKLLMCWIEYLGVEKDFAEQPTIIALSYKKQRNQEISAEEEKENNKIHSKKKRIVIEHTICRLKKYIVYLHIYLETN